MPTNHGCLARRSDRDGADDILLDDDVARPADQQQVLDVVASNQDQPAARIERGGIDYREARLAPARGGCADPRTAEATQRPQRYDYHRQNDHQKHDDLRERHLCAEQTVKHRSRSSRP
jgi:hypothetical protein